MVVRYWLLGINLGLNLWLVDIRKIEVDGVSLSR